VLTDSVRPGSEFNIGLAQPSRFELSLQAAGPNAGKLKLEL